MTGILSGSLQKVTIDRVLRLIARGLTRTAIRRTKGFVGRAANTSVRRERLEARITREQKKLFQKAADLQGCTVTDFIVSSAQDAAMRTIQERTIMTLSERDREVFVAALLAPAVPKGRLAKAAERYKRVTAE